MREYEALRLALYLYHLPSAVRAAREKPLPKGISSLLEIAAGEGNAAEQAALDLERPAEVVRQASEFFIEQILLAPDTDAYRILGAASDAPDAELRRHMALLQRWVHPDMERAGDRTVYAARVTRAWESLKSADRRAAYDAANPPKERSAKRHPYRRQRRQKASASARPGMFGAALRFLFGSRKQQ